MQTWHSSIWSSSPFNLLLYNVNTALYHANVIRLGYVLARLMKSCTPNEELHTQWHKKVRWQSSVTTQKFSCARVLSFSRWRQFIGKWLQTYLLQQVGNKLSAGSLRMDEQDFVYFALERVEHVLALSESVIFIDERVQHTAFGGDILVRGWLPTSRL